MHLHCHLNHASTVPARLGMISIGSVNMNTWPKRAKIVPSLAVLTVMKQPGTEPARPSTFSPASVKNIEPIPCCSWAMPSTKLVRFSPKNVWQRYHDCVATFHVCAFLYISFAKKRRDHEQITMMNQYHMMCYQTSHPLNQKLTELRPL